MMLKTSSQSTSGSDHQEMESSMQAASSHDSHMEVDQGKLIMDEELWKDFLPDLHVEILGSFSILELCQFRTISPAWNDLAEHVVSRAWNDIMAQLKARPQAMYMFRTPTTLDLGVGSAENLVRPSWEVYDPSTRQCFPLNMQFLNTEDEIGRLRRVEDGCTTIAADKGFICVVPNFHSSLRTPNIKVVNPMTGGIVKLPPLSRTDYYNRVVSLVVADNYSEFSLYVVQGRPYDTPLTQLFDSKVGVWRELPHLPARLWPSHILYMKSTLFTLFRENHGWENSGLHLFGLDTTTTRSEWRNTGVELPQHVVFPQLATALGRLFFAAFMVDRIELREVDVTAASCTVVASMDKSDKFYEERKWLDDCWRDAVAIVVVGCENFIVFSSVSGASVAYDVVNCKWCEWIQSTKIVRDVDCDQCGLYGSCMSLTLNPVPEVRTGI